MNRPVFTVTQANNYVRGLLDRDILLSNIFLKGEISNYRRHASGHMYFTIKDSESMIRCVFFDLKNSLMEFEIENGMAVIVSGNISIYTRDGLYQLYVDSIKMEGVGDLYKKFESLKARLEKDGMFKKEYKKAIPLFPKKIAIITSQTGAAIKDMLKVISERNSAVDILIVPVSVQGDYAKEDISSAIEYVNTLKDIDTIIVGRGGGSIEDLWAFNEEVVARAIFNSKIPIISAVGHETDFTIADLVADARAATPSVAGEMVVLDLAYIYEILSTFLNRLNISIKRIYDNKSNSLNYYKESYILKYPERMLLYSKQRLDTNVAKLNNVFDSYYSDLKGDFLAKTSYLEALNPLRTMLRGFCVLEDLKDKRIIKTIKDLDKGMEAKLILRDGSADCVIRSVKEDLHV